MTRASRRGQIAGCKSRGMRTESQTDDGAASYWEGCRLQAAGCPKLLLSGLLTVVLAACGGGGSPGTSHNEQVISNAQQSAASAQSIKQALLTLPSARIDRTGDVEYLAPGEDPADLTVDAGCDVEVILTSPEDVATYKGAPDVVLNPAGTAGVKVDGTDQAEAGCLQEAGDVLKKIK